MRYLFRADKTSQTDLIREQIFVFRVRFFVREIHDMAGGVKCICTEAHFIR